MKTKQIRELYPKGTWLVLDGMDDRQAPPIGTCGEVIGVDDMGTIHVAWDNGSSLGLIYGYDTFHKMKFICERCEGSEDCAEIYPQENHCELFVKKSVF